MENYWVISPDYIQGASCLRCVKYLRNARIARNARSELALKYTQASHLRCLRCVALETALQTSASSC